MGAMTERSFPLPNRRTGDSLRLLGCKVNPVDQSVRDVLDSRPAITELLAVRLLNAEPTIHQLDSDVPA